jgi:outer membrane lipoprotein-sorting protein
MNKPSRIRSSRIFFSLRSSSLFLPLLLVSLISAPRALHGQDSQAYQVLYAASDRYYSLETLCAHFEQVIEVTLLRQTRSGEGTVCQQRPDRFSMRFSDPEGDLVVGDGEFLWTYYPSLDDKQVIRFSGGGGGGLNFYRNFLEDPRGRFEAVHEGREPMGDGVSHKITLTPKETGGVRSADFRTAVVWFDVDSFLITGLDIHDRNETIRKIRLTDIRVDLRLSDEEFRFVPPEGARVMRAPEGPGVNTR